LGKHLDEIGEYYFKENRPAVWSLIFSGQRNSETVWPMKRRSHRRIKSCMKQGPWQGNSRSNSQDFPLL